MEALICETYEERLSTINESFFSQKYGIALLNGRLHMIKNKNFTTIATFHFSILYSMFLLIFSINSQFLILTVL